MSRAISHIDTFQGLILALQNYWAEYRRRVTTHTTWKWAGTFPHRNFHYAFRSETWNAAYVQPSSRPKDGRYGEKPKTAYNNTIISSK